MRHPTALVYDRKTHAWLSFNSEPLEILTTNSYDEVYGLITRAEELSKFKGLWVIGWLSYDAAPAFDGSYTVNRHPELPLLWFAAFSSPTTLSELPKPTNSSRFPELVWRPALLEADYASAFLATIKQIERGDTYQVNLSFRLLADLATLGRDLSTNDLSYQLFYQMANSHRGEYAVYIDTARFSVCSASPELFFELDSSGKITCRPMKGTAKREHSDDNRRKSLLANSEKERAENVMIVDMVRNDLSRIALDGSVSVDELFKIESYPHVFQMVSEVSAKCDTSLYEVLKALFPSASITGAPKKRTMEIIAELEDSPRGLYTGTLGVLKPDGGSWFNVAIRTAVVDHLKMRAEYGVGSGVVWDSKLKSEYNECILKARAALGVFEGSYLFETLRWEPHDGNQHDVYQHNVYQHHGYQRLELHLARLSKSAKDFGSPFNLSRVKELLSSKELELSKDTDTAKRVKLILFNTGKVAIEIHPIPKTVMPYRVALALNAVSSRDLRLLHKTSDRSIYDQAKPVVAEVDDVLLWNERGEVTESRIANLIVEIDGYLFTPPVACGLLAGCLREELLSSFKVSERVIKVEELLTADKIYLANSLRGVWEVELVTEKGDFYG